MAFAKIDYTSRDVDAFFADAETLGVADAMRATFPEKIKTGRLVNPGEIFYVLRPNVSTVHVDHRVMHRVTNVSWKTGSFQLTRE